MPAGNNSPAAKPGSRLRELGLVLPEPPTPLEAYVETAEVGSLLFLSGASDLFVQLFGTENGHVRTVVRCSKSAHRHACRGGGHLRDQ